MDKQPSNARTPAPSAAVDAERFPFFKGATRVPTVAGGIPTRPFVGLIMVAATLGMVTLYAWALVPALYPVMAMVTRQDDRAFRIIELWLRTRVVNHHKRFWRGSTYAPAPYPRGRWTPSVGERR